MARRKHSAPPIPQTGPDYSYLRLPIEARRGDVAPGSKIGVFIHAYYEQEIVALLPYLAHIRAPFELFVTTDSESKKAFLLETLRPIYGDAVTVGVFDNRGRDIAPKYVGFRDQQLACDLVLHLHTKKSLHDSKLAAWRSFMLDCLIGSPATCGGVLDLFANNPKLGVVAPRIFPAVHPAVRWGENYCKTVYLARRMGVRLERPTQIDFPAGSMFWARSAALRPILDLGLGFGSFEAEGGQVDGTTAHAIERLIFYSAERAGYRSLHAGGSGDPEKFETLIDAQDLELGWVKTS
ncbi:rhamnan synthesis F family protein [Rhodoblastus sp.]|jgi:lipopolysaccharide biosynthesis protein|uniref:rhamnan synthesis F family protein n=1 Tax=Rhodoblastus sp. TaxID=1962975 RepID=UPI0025FAB4A8|nr:rhamnan synthesis F family protein [Rhodoblastus sp.]